MIFIEDLVEGNEKILEELGWDPNDIGPLTGIQAMLLSNIIELKKENLRLRDRLDDEISDFKNEIFRRTA